MSRIRSGNRMTTATTCSTASVISSKLSLWVYMRSEAAVTGFLITLSNMRALDLQTAFMLS
jgi:hypothetical protein